MKRSSACFVVTIIALAILKVSVGDVRGEDAEVASPFAKPSSTVEARGRAKLLHELIHGTLQVVHRDFFDEEDAHSIPSASLEDVFHEMARSFAVDIKWLNVNTDVVNTDHEPADEFEREAVKRLGAGAEFYESTADDRYRFAGRIRLRSQCLKCHVKRRTNNRERTAGLIISMPLRSMHK